MLLLSWGAGRGEGIPLKREQDGGEALLCTTDSSIGWLKTTRSSLKPAICMDSGF